MDTEKEEIVPRDRGIPFVKEETAAKSKLDIEAERVVAEDDEGTEVSRSAGIGLSAGLAGFAVCSAARGGTGAASDAATGGAVASTPEAGGVSAAAGASAAGVARTVSAGWDATSSGAGAGSALSWRGRRRTESRTSATQ